jgi:probable poly-beta-1,6-N-acetyl-D-glucosamine export protein
MSKNQTTLSKQNSFKIKAIAIIAVIILHILSLFPKSIYTSNPYRSLFISINQICRFCVPMFLIISGYGLSRKYFNRDLSPINFLKSRIKKLLPLYFLWSAIFLIISKISNTWSYGSINLWENIFLGNTDYHLYFIPLIFQFYLLFALLPKNKKKYRLLIMVLGSGVIQIIWFLLIRGFFINKSNYTNFIANDQLQYRLLINWIFYFLFGISLAKFNFKKIQKVKIFKLTLVLISFLSLSWSIYDAHKILNQTNNIIYATSFIRPPIIIYTIGTALIMIFYNRQIFDQKILKYKFLLLIGKHSYIIYLSHTLLLRVLQGIITGTPRPSIIAIGSILFSTGVAISKHLLA